jgi:nicotinate-nucleotide adenylyltransferase
MILSLLETPPHNPEPKKPFLRLVTRASAGLSQEKGRLGVLGGAYNPITLAHLILARAAREQFHLQEVILVLSKVSPYKPLMGGSIDQRLEMMRLSTARIPFISIGLCTHGLFLDICTAVKQVYPQNPELFFITGRDAAERILTWPYEDPGKTLARMFSAFQLLVFARHGDFTLPKAGLIRKYSSHIHSLQVPENLDQISSSTVRQRTLADLPIEHLVPLEVMDYIKQNRLYEDLSEE